MPRPLKGETKRQYIQRAVRYMMRVEGLGQKQAVAKAHGMWKSNRKRR